MSDPLATFSGVERAMACDLAVFGPKTSDTSRAAERGTWLHWYSTRRLTGGEAAAVLAGVPAAWRGACDVLEGSLTGLTGGVPVLGCEMAFAYRPRDGRVRLLGHDLGRNYVCDHDEIPGALDLVTVDGGSMGEASVAVTDLKTGQAVTRSARNWQLRIGAICARRHFGAETVLVRLVYFDEDAGELVEDSTRFDSRELDLFEDMLRERWAYLETELANGLALAVDDAHPLHEETPGPHCKYCPTKGACPEFAGAANALVRFDADWVERAKASVEDDAQAAWLLARTRQAAEALGALDKILRARIAKRPIPMGRKSARFVHQMRPSINGVEARRYLAERYGAEVAEAACKPTLSKKGLTGAFGDLGPQIFEELKTAGVVTFVRTPSLRVPTERP